MPPKRKAQTTAATETSVDPSLTPSNQDDAPSEPTAGPSKRTKTTGKSKTATISAERKEANRLAAERSRVRRATRASILEQTAKGLAEENLVLKERIKKLVAMGVSVDAGGVAVGEGLVEETAQVATQAETLGKRSTPVIPDAIADPQLDIPITTSSSVELPPPILRTGNKSSLQVEMEAHFRQQIDELRTLLQEKREQVGSQVDETMEDAEDLETQHRQIQDVNNRLQHEIRILHDAVSRVRAEQARAENVNERLRIRVRETEAQLLVKEGVARTGADAGFRIDESRSDVQRAFKDLKRHLGLLIGVSLLLSTADCADGLA